MEARRSARDHAVGAGVVLACGIAFAAAGLAVGGPWWLILYAVVAPPVAWGLMIAGDVVEPLCALPAWRVRRAMRRGEIVLHFQPKATVGSGRVCSVEALARWRHPKRGLLAPAAWIDATESRWLRRSFALYVVEAALRQLRAWLDEGQDLVVNVNLSPACLADDALADRILELLADCNVPPDALRLEVTEVAFALSEHTDRVAARLAAAGVGLALDDYGAGESSPERLVRLPIDELKIDRRFVRDIHGSDRNRAVVRAAIGLGHSMGMSVVAEGVEDQPTLTALEELGCDMVQGFFLACPLPADTLGRWMRRREAAIA